MEDIVGLLFTLLFIFGTSLLRGRREQKSGTAPPQKRTFADFGRELIKQIEEMDKGPSTPAPSPKPKVEVRPVYQPQSVQSAEGEIEVESIQAYLEKTGRMDPQPSLDPVARPIIVNTKPLKVERASSKGLPIKRSLTQRELKQSIVMAEVLGPPRAKRPHALAKH